MGLLEDAISILNNSKKVPALTIMAEAADSDYALVYNNVSQKIERITVSNFRQGSTPNFSRTYLGSTSQIGETTANLEIETFINLIGFSIAAQQIKVIEITVLVNGIPTRNKYFYSPNLPGSYGDFSGTPITFDELILVSSLREVIDEEEQQVIDLGDIGGSSIEAHINALVGTAYELNANIIYLFKCVKDTIAENYLYTGVLPNIIGDGGNVVTADNFYLLSENTTPIPLEEQILGTVLEDAAVTGSYALNATAVSHFDLTLTGNTTLTTINEPGPGLSTALSGVIRSSPTETLGVPGGWIIIGEYVADGSDNICSLIISNLPSGSPQVILTITQA